MTSTQGNSEKSRLEVKKIDNDFLFQLTRTEYREILGSKFLTLDSQISLNLANFEQKDNLRSNLTSSEGSKFDPQNILRSKKLTTITGANDAENLRCKHHPASVPAFRDSEGLALRRNALQAGACPRQAARGRVRVVRIPHMSSCQGILDNCQGVAGLAPEAPQRG